MINESKKTAPKGMKKGPRKPNTGAGRRGFTPAGKGTRSQTNLEKRTGMRGTAKKLAGKSAKRKPNKAARKKQ